MLVSCMWLYLDQRLRFTISSRVLVSQTHHTCSLLYIHLSFMGIVQIISPVNMRFSMPLGSVTIMIVHYYYIVGYSLGHKQRFRGHSILISVHVFIDSLPNRLPSSVSVLNEQPYNDNSNNMNLIILYIMTQNRVIIS